MIATLTGTVRALGLDSLIIDVQGVGYAVRTTPAALQATRTGATLTLHTELIVREDSLTLYGFPERDEADVFRLVQSVSGIGPRIALAVLTVLGPDDLRRAVASEDSKAIARTPGIGPKVASRMILELQGKLHAPTAAELPGASVAPGALGDSSGPVSADHQDVIDALVSLGWQQTAATSAVKTASSQLGDGAQEPSVLLRAALQTLGGSR